MNISISTTFFLISLAVFFCVFPLQFFSLSVSVLWLFNSVDNGDGGIGRVEWHFVNLQSLNGFHGDTRFSSIPFVGYWIHPLTMQSLTSRIAFGMFPLYSWLYHDEDDDDCHRIARPRLHNLYLRRHQLHSNDKATYALVRKHKHPSTAHNK